MLTWMEYHILTLIVFSPLLGIPVLLVTPRVRVEWQRIFALGATLIPLLFSIWLFNLFQSFGGMEFEELHPWIPNLHIFYRVGVDGLSLPLLLLTTFLMPIVMIGSWKEPQKSVKEYLLAFLVLEVGMLGTFVALDLILFYVFWELMLIPMYLIIGVWGGERRVYAAIKFVLFTMFGSLLMLAGILYLYFVGGQSFDLFDLYQVTLPARTQLILFVAFALAFVIKVPLFPFHTWLPDAHVEAPTAGSVILAGVLLKMGGYGLLRFALPLFPQALEKGAPFLATLSVIGIIYGALVAMVQPDLKKLVAYSSVSHMGFVILGLTAMNVQGVSGATLQMVNHGISTGALFLLVGMIYERRHTRQIADYGGLASVMPLYATIFLIVTFSSIALPGTNGFVGEFLILLGAFKTQMVYAILASLGVVFAAIYMLWMVRRVFFGKITRAENQNLRDLSYRELGVLIPLVILIFVIGIKPGFLLSKIEPSASKLVQRVTTYVRVVDKR